LLNARVPPELADALRFTVSLWTKLIGEAGGAKLMVCPARLMMTSATLPCRYN
jgi:hypothetical protein